MDIIKKFEARVAEELTPIDREQAFRDMLDGCTPEVKIGCLTFSPSRIVEELDPVAFRCGVNDYFSDGEHVEIGTDTFRADDVEKIRNKMIGEMDDEATDIEQEIDEILEQPEGEQFAEELAELKAKRDAILSNEKELRKHSI